MSHWQAAFSDRDLLFMIDTLIPGRTDKERLVASLRDDAQFVEAMLAADKLFESVHSDQEILVKITPWLFFAVILQRAKKDLQKEAYTIERSHRQKIPVFDSEQVAGLLDRQRLAHYLADMLASFVKMESFSMSVRVRPGVWHRYRFSDMDVDGLVRCCQVVDEEQRLAFYKRIGDVCLFLCGMFPEYIESQSRDRRRFTGWHSKTIEEYREEGQEFYELAAQHQAARSAALDETLATLAHSFVQAEKALAYTVDRYLQFRKHDLFGVG